MPQAAKKMEQSAHSVTHRGFAKQSSTREGYRYTQPSRQCLSVRPVYSHPLPQQVVYLVSTDNSSGSQFGTIVSF